MINGMNWDYFPIGTNYTYSLWKQSDDFIKAALDTEMPMLKNMGVNAIRVYTGIQPKWIKYIYEKYGIYTMLNHSFGRYGLTLNGNWVANTEYDNPLVKELLIKEVTEIVRVLRACFYIYWVTKIITGFSGKELKQKIFPLIKENQQLKPKHCINSLTKRQYR